MNENISHDFRALPIGTILSDYQVDSILGQGSFGITYLALDTMLNRRVAVKEYFPREFAARDGIKFDASIGVGEDLADISAMAICDEYLRDFQYKNDDLIPIKAFSYEVFYTYFAYQQRQFVNKKALVAQLKTNPHPLDKYRCNIPLSRSEIFRALYNVKKGDGMWWHNTDTIW